MFAWKLNFVKILSQLNYASKTLSENTYKIWKNIKFFFVLKFCSKSVDSRFWYPMVWKSNWNSQKRVCLLKKKHLANFYSAGDFGFYKNIPLAFSYVTDSWSIIQFKSKISFFFWMNLVKHFNLATENWSNIPGQTFRFLTKKSDYTTAILNSKLWAQSGHHVSGQVIISVVAVWPMGNWPPYGDYDLVGNFQLLFLIGQHVTLILKYLLRPKYFQFRRHYTQWRRFFRTDSQIWEDGNCSVRNLDFVA